MITDIVNRADSVEHKSGLRLEGLLGVAIIVAIQSAVYAERQQEQDRIVDLRARCAKKGLDFETENRKYLEKKALKLKKAKLKKAAR